MNWIRKTIRIWRRLAITPKPAIKHPERIAHGMAETMKGTRR